MEEALPRGLAINPHAPLGERKTRQWWADARRYEAALLQEEARKEARDRTTRQNQIKIVQHGPAEDRARRARLLRGYSRGEFWALGEWPINDEEARSHIILNAHKNNHERWVLFAFLVFNGMTADMAQEWIEAADYDPDAGRFIRDPAANTKRFQDHMKQLRRQHLLHTLQWGSQWDMVAQRAVDIEKHEFIHG